MNLTKKKIFIAIFLFTIFTIFVFKLEKHSSNSRVLANQGQILLEDNFNQGISDWTPFKDAGSWKWAPNEGKNASGAYKHIEKLDDAITLYKENSWDNYRYEADVKVLEGSRVGLLFRGFTKPKGNGKWKKLGGYYLFLLPKSNKIVLKRNQFEGECANPGKSGSGCWPLHPAFVKTIAEAKYNLAFNSWYNLAIEVSGNDIKGYVDNNLVLEVSDNSFASGTVGFKTHQSKIIVDNVKVTALGAGGGDGGGDNGNDNEGDFNWNQTSIFPNGKTTEIPRSFAIGDYYYVIPKSGGGAIIKAKQQNNGSLSEWSETYKQKGIHKTHGYPVITVDNQAYLMPYCSVLKTNITQNGEITSLTEMNDKNNDGKPDGFTNGECYVWGAAVLADFGNNKYVFHFGGVNPFAGDAYLGTINRAVPIATSSWNWQKVGDLGVSFGRLAAFYRSGNNGFIFLTRDGDISKLYRLSVDSSGNIGNVQDIGNLPNGYVEETELGELIVIDNYLYTIGGDNNMGKKVFRSKINSSGNIGSWEALHDLPGPANHIGYAIINNYLYVTGVNKVYFAKISEGGGEPPTSCSEQINGDYNCDGDVNNADFTDWKNDYINNKTTLSFFEYWRRESYK